MIVFAKSSGHWVHVFNRQLDQECYEILQEDAVFFPDYPDDDDEEEEEEDDDLSESHQYSAMYWELLSPILTKLVLQLEGIKAPIENMDWLNQCNSFNIWNSMVSSHVLLTLTDTSAIQLTCCQTVKGSMMTSCMIVGSEYMDRVRPHVSFPVRLSLSALRLMRLEKFSLSLGSLPFGLPFPGGPPPQGHPRPHHAHRPWLKQLPDHS